MNRHCYIAGAGEFVENVLPEDGDYIIAADGGYLALTSRGITPDLVVGDFDSLGKVPDHPNIIQSPVEKNDTDMVLAVKQGLERGNNLFTINGGLGGRLDQTLANIQILAYLAENDAFGTLFGLDVCIIAIKGGEVELSVDTTKGKNISIFSHGEKAVGVTLKGLKYPLENATITNTYPVGVSNEFTDEDVVISVDSGTLIIMWETKAREESVFTNERY